MKKKYLYNGSLVDETDVMDAAKQSNVDIDTYIKKAGMQAIDDTYSYKGKDVPAQDILDAAKKSKLGFDDYIQKAGFEKKNQIGNASGIISSPISSQLKEGEEEKGLYPNADPSIYETKLSSADEPKFQSWLDNNYKQGKIPKGDYDFYKKNGYGYNYDFRAAFKENTKSGVNTKDNKIHWGDIGKKPNHPTFSDESKYNNVDGFKGGSWDGENFIPPISSQSQDASSITSPKNIFYSGDLFKQKQTRIPEWQPEFKPVNPKYPIQRTYNGQTIGFKNKDEADFYEQNNKVTPERNIRSLIMGEPKPVNLSEATEQDKTEHGNRFGYIMNNLVDGISSEVAGANDLLMQGLINVLPQSVVGGDKNEAIKQWREKVTPQVRETLNKNLGDPISQNKKDKFDNEFLTSAIGGLMHTVPAILSPKGTKAAAFFTQAYDNGIQTINSTENGKALPENTKTVFGAGVGTAQAIILSLGIDKILGKGVNKVAVGLANKTFNKLLQSSTAPITADLFDAALNAEAKTLKSQLVNAGAKTAQSAIIGAAIGGALEGTDMLAKDIANKASDENIFEPKSWGERFSQIGHSIASGAVGGGLLGALSLPFSKTRNYISEKVSEAKTSNDIEALKNELAAKSPEITPEETQHLNGLIDDYVRVNSKIPDDTPNRTATADKIIEREDIQNTITQKQQEINNVDEAFQPEMSKEIDVLNNKVDEINNEITKTGETEDIYVEPNKEVSTVGDNTFKVNKPNRNEFKNGVEGDQPYADAMEQYHNKVADHVKNLTDGVITDSEGNKFTVRESASGAIVEDKFGQVVFKKGKFYSSGNPIVGDFKFDPKDQNIKTNTPENNESQTTEVSDTAPENSPTDEGINKVEQPTEEIKTGESSQNTEPVSEPSKTVSVSDEGINGITHAANEVRRQDRLLPEYEKSPETFEKWNNEAEGLIKSGYDVEGLMDNIEKGHDPNPVQNAIRKIYIATLDAEIAKTPTDELLAKQKRFIQIGDLANSRAGRNLASLKGVNSPLSNISDFYVAKMEALNVDNLTDVQKAEISKQYNDIQQKSKVAEEKLAAYEAQIARLKAESEIKKNSKKWSNTKNKKTHEDHVKYREEVFSNIRDKLKKSRGETSAVIVPYAKELITIAPEVAKLVKDLFEEGVTKLEDIVKNIHGQLKPDIPQLEEKDVHDIIAGEYNKKQKTKTQLQLDLKDLQDEAKLINKLDELQNGEAPKTENAKIERNQKIKDLQDKVKAIKKEGVDSGKFYGESDTGNKRIEKMEDELLRLKERREKEPKGDSKRIISNKEKELKNKIEIERKKIKTEESDAKKFYKDDTSEDARKLINIRRRNLKETDEINAKLAKGEFGKEPKSSLLEDQEMKRKYPKLYKDAMDAIISKENVKHNFEVSVLKDAMAKRGTGEKFFDKTKDVIGTMKALRAGIDFSALMIQNIVPILSHPIDNADNVRKSFRDLAHPKKFERDLTALHNSKYWDLIKKSGLDVTEPKSAEAKNKEEAFNRNLLEKDFEIKGKKYNIGKYITAPFERAFTSLGNNIRVSNFLKVAEKLESDGYTFESHPKKFTDAAKLFNTQTGRGTLPEFIQKANETVNTIFWSPKLMASRLNLLGLGDIANPIFAKRPGFYRSLGENGKILSPLQKRAALDMVKFVSTVVGTYAAAAYFLGAKPDLDPTSVTFGDIKEANGPKSYNLFGGFSQYIKLAAIMALGIRQTGNKTEDISDAKGKSRGDLALKFLRGKTTPSAGVAVDLADKKDYMGKPIDVKEELLSLVTPMSMSGIPEDMSRDGVVKAFANGLISMTGINVKDERDYDKISSYSKEDLDDPTLKYFIDKGIDLPRDNSKSKVIKDNEEGKERNISYYGEEKVKEYKDLRTKYLKEVLSKIQDKGVVYVDRYGHASLSYDGEEKKIRTDFSELTKSQLKEIMSIASGKATEKAANELFNKKEN